MDKLSLSPDFTIDDIHKIREHNYEITKDMSMEEKLEYYNHLGTAAEKETKRRRALKRRK
ncbi:MAG: hypothetical protein HFE75_13995 [Firmicutes bacterium]|jgi:hypothetical protein|nr:hypothetical protein [Bacillota bacterium]NBI64531.1 hypothetical protein [Clostridiales bacterium]